MGTLVINSAEIGEGVAFVLLVHDEESGKLFHGNIELR